MIQDATGFAQEVAKVKLTTKGNYSDELIQAYVFAKDLGITSMDTIDQANMTGSLMRSHMAKMIANFSLKILHTSLNTGVVCNFKDIAQESQELQYYMQAACQLGLMGYENNGVRVKSQFDTVNMVDRAQFGTVLSRMLRGTQYAG